VLISFGPRTLSRKPNRRAEYTATWLKGLKKENHAARFAFYSLWPIEHGETAVLFRLAGTL
jgi:hypothetical protein